MSTKVDLASAQSSGLPMLRRFEKLTGANSFIRSWEYKGTKGPSKGKLIFPNNGNVQLQSFDDPPVVLGISVVPWKYVSPKGADTVVRVLFTIDDVDGEDVMESLSDIGAMVVVVVDASSGSMTADGRADGHLGWA